MIIKQIDFQKGLVFWLVVIMAVLLLSECFISCKAKKALVETQTSNVMIAEKSAVKESNEKSLPIADTIFVPVGNIITGSEDCDIKCNEALKKQLKGLNTKKKSGNNESGFYYDEYGRMLVAYSKLGETNSRLRDSISNLSVIDHKKEIKPVLIPAEFTKEQKFNMWTGRLFWIAAAIWIFTKIRKAIPA